jgi:hypothetical protein
MYEQCLKDVSITSKHISMLNHINLSDGNEKAMGKSSPRRAVTQACARVVTKIVAVQKKLVTDKYGAWQNKTKATETHICKLL